MRELQEVNESVCKTTQTSAVVSVLYVTFVLRRLWPQSMSLDSETCALKRDELSDSRVEANNYYNYYNVVCTAYAAGTNGTLTRKCRRVVVVLIIS